ncbi:MAG: hypothetical protein A2234_11270 [Elusimicrobia bacterium RIFOXYA2_FULL_58_8]|nr:MAG: hypothetical protein A2285_08530 [Elusimicrobia bacterium RIFOXYA12_FULL_57_11]OGS14520.1 MAG: hypothetical protein A2234_11270 [Elusimicrobia bacterium RIFOXYA2_FULL_58_8]
MASKNNKKNTDLSRFLTSEEGKIVKGDVVKIAAVLGIVAGAVQQAEAASGSHDNYFHNAGSAGTYHNSHGSHASHGSHGSHGQW